MSLALAGRFSTTGPPGMSLDVLTWMTDTNAFLKFSVWVRLRKEFLHVFWHTEWFLNMPSVTDVFLQKMEKKSSVREDSVLADKASCITVQFPDMLSSALNI